MKKKKKKSNKGKKKEGKEEKRNENPEAKTLDDLTERDRRKRPVAAGYLTNNEQKRHEHLNLCLCLAVPYRAAPCPCPVPRAPCRAIPCRCRMPEPYTCHALPRFAMTCPLFYPSFSLASNPPPAFPFLCGGGGDGGRRGKQPCAVPPTRLYLSQCRII